MVGEQTAIAQLVNRGRVDREHQLGDIARLRKGMHPYVDALQVEQHSRQDLRFRGMAEQMRLERLVFVIVGMSPQQLATRVFGEERTAVKGVNDQIF